MMTLVTSKVPLDKLNLSDREFKLIASLVDSIFGIHLGENKKILVKSRLRSLILSKGLGSFGDYYDIVKNDITGIELLTLVDKISTNHSFFFREIEHFNFIGRNLSILLNLPSVKSRGKLTFWSAGCSSGEEPYTIAMVMHELKDKIPGGIEVKILATDISLSILREAKAGVYDKEKLRLVPKYYLNRYFEKQEDGRFRIREYIKSMVLFKSLNLMRGAFPFKGKFDVIFCRNVMIYFTKDTRDDLVNRFVSVLNPGGYLFTGHSETLGRNHPKLVYLEPAVYKYG